MNTYEQDNVVRVSVTFKDAAGANADPTEVKLRVKIGADAAAEYAYGEGGVVSIVRDGAGLYHADLLVDAQGTWRYKWLGTGAVTAADEKAFAVSAANL